MELISFEGWNNCIRLTTDQIELIVTTEIGPRIIFCGFINGQNLLYIFPDDKGKKGGNEFRYYGGHRLWHSPEVFPRTYAPDNFKVNYEWDGKVLKLFQEIEETTGIVKEIEISLNNTNNRINKSGGMLSSDRNSVHLVHRLINKNLWDIELAPWAITALAPGGRAIIPQEPYIDPADYMLPSRPIVLWHYTKMDDPRWSWGEKYIQLKQDHRYTSEQKIGIANKQKWCGYQLFNDLFIKVFDYKPEANYPDYGCNNEIWTDGNFLELESLGSYGKIPSGGIIEHEEDWLITKTEANNSEESISSEILPFIEGFIKNSVAL